MVSVTLDCPGNLHKTKKSAHVQYRHFLQIFSLCSWWSGQIHSPRVERDVLYVLSSWWDCGSHVLRLCLCPLQGEYQLLLELYNENRATVACANATVTCS